MENIMGISGMVFGAVAMITVFSFVAVASWVEGRRKEREALYRHELQKQMLAQPGPAADRIAAMFEAEARMVQVKAREGHKLGGLITTVVGIGLMVFLRMVVPGGPPVYLVGLIPLFVGIAMLIYVYVLAPKPE